jgi:hypothetical protein
MSQDTKYIAIDHLDQLCMQCNNWVVNTYNSETVKINMNDTIREKNLGDVMDLIERHRTRKDSLVMQSMILYHDKCDQYLTRFLKVYKAKKPSIAPFQYNELTLLYSQVAINRNILQSAISYAAMMEQIRESIGSLDDLKVQMEIQLSKMQEKNDLNFSITSSSIQTLNETSVKIDSTVQRNKKKLNWALGITGATGAVAVAILILTMIQ